MRLINLVPDSFTKILKRAVPEIMRCRKNRVDRSSRFHRFSRLWMLWTASTPRRMSAGAFVGVHDFSCAFKRYEDTAGAVNSDEGSTSFLLASLDSRGLLIRGSSRNGLSIGTIDGVHCLDFLDQITLTSAPYCVTECFPLLRKRSCRRSDRVDRGC